MLFSNILEKLGVNDVLGYKLFEIQDSEVTVLSVLFALFIMIISMIVSKIVQRGVRGAIGHETPDQEAASKTTNRLVNYAILLIGFAIALSAIGLNLRALFTAGAVFAVGIGFAVQSILENFFSGLVLMFDRSIRPGDVIEIEEEMVRVQDIRVRTTTVTNLDGDEFIVPNSKLAQSTVKNMSVPHRGHRIRASVGVHYDSDLDIVFDTLNRVAEKFPERLENKEPLVLLKEFGSSSVNFDVFVWISNSWLTPRLESKLMKAVWDALAEADIVIAYPQVDVHFDPDVIDRLSVTDGARRRKSREEDDSSGPDEQAREEARQRQEERERKARLEEEREVVRDQEPASRDDRVQEEEPVEHELDPEEDDRIDD